MDTASTPQGGKDRRTRRECREDRVPRLASENVVKRTLQDAI